MNAAVFSGRLTKDPVAKDANNARKATFTIAVHRPLTRDICDFIDCVAWNEKADFVVRNFRRGVAVEVKGIIVTREGDYQGTKQKKTELRIDEAAFSRDHMYE